MKQWSCNKCQWEGTSEDNVQIMFHACRPPTPRRTPIPLPPLWVDEITPLTWSNE